LHLGDSGIILPNLIQNIKKGITFWLDGHYSSLDTACAKDYCSPIVFELMSISDAFMLHNNCQFVLEESNKIKDFIDNSEFLYKPIVEDVQILKVTEFLNTFFVEWKKN
jgi:hypothetical protein